MGLYNLIQLLLMDAPKSNSYIWMHSTQTIILDALPSDHAWSTCLLITYHQGIDPVIVTNST